MTLHDKSTELLRELLSTFNIGIEEFRQTLSNSQNSRLSGWFGRVYNHLQEIRNAESEQYHD